MRVIAVVIALLMLVPIGQAQFFDALPYEDSQEYAAGLEGIPALISAAMEFNATDARNATLLMGTTGVTVTGLDGVVWQDENGDFQIHQGKNLSIEVEDGGSFAFRSSREYDVDADAGHALTFFADASQMFGNDPDGSDRPEDLALGPALVAIPTDETIAIAEVEPIPAPSSPPSGSQGFNGFTDDLALLLALSDSTTVNILQSGDPVDNMTGSGSWVGFWGSPVFSTTTAGMAVLPMPDGTGVTFTPAEQEVVERGLSTENLESAFGSMAESEGEESAGAGEGIGQVTQALAGFLDGAYIDLGVQAPVDGEEQGGEQQVPAGELLGSMTLVRFEHLDASRSGDDITFDGAAALQIQDGDVVGAKPLVGGFVPLASIFLWGFAVAFLVLGIVLRPNKENKLWDGLHWIGRIGGILAIVVAFIIWDSAMATLWGVSLIQSDASGATKGAIAVLEIVPLLLAALFFGVPTRILVRSATPFLGQGRMMNIGGIIAPFVTVLLGVPLMLSLIDAVLERLGGA